MIEREEAKERIEKFISLYEEYEIICDKIGEVFGHFPEGPVQNLFGKFIDAYIKILEDQVGDNFGSIAWFIFDNDKGNKGYEVELNSNKAIKVKTVNDLIEVLYYGE